MIEHSTGTHTRQSRINPCTVASPSMGANGGSRRGDRERQRWPRPVTRGHLLQDDGEVSSASLSHNGVVDWYAFTLPCPEGVKPSVVAGDVEGWVPPASGRLERGMMGYTDGVILPGEGRVLWNDARPDMGVHVELPSKCLRLVEVDAIDLCGWVHLRGGQATRVDVAIDTDQVPMSEVIAAQNGNCLVSRAQDRQLIYNYRDGSQTLYVGAPSSRRRVRFYDKALEQEAKTGEVYPGIWTRCEVQFRREQANMVSEYIGLGSGLTDIVNSCVDFRATWQDSNISRCDRLSWWDEWLGKADKVSFAVGSLVADVVGQAYTWVQKQVAPTLAFLKKALGGSSVDALVDAASGRIPEYRLRVLSAMSGSA